MGILFETTGFKVESDESLERFWENYRDFESLSSTNLVREDKNERVAANAEKKKVNLD